MFNLNFSRLSAPENAFGSPQRTVQPDGQLTAGEPREPHTRQYLGGALSSLASNAPRASPHDDDKGRPAHGPVSDLQTPVLQALIAKHHEQIEGYKRATEALILERYYALEQNMQHMLQELSKTTNNQDTSENANSHRVPQAILPQRELQAPPPSSIPPAILAQLDKLISAAEARAAEEADRCLLTEQIVAQGIRSVESTLEREMRKQAALIETMRVGPVGKKRASSAASVEDGARTKGEKGEKGEKGSLKQTVKINDPKENKSGVTLEVDFMGFSQQLDGHDTKSDKRSSPSQSKAQCDMSKELGQTIGFDPTAIHKNGVSPRRDEVSVAPSSRFSRFVSTKNRVVHKVSSELGNALGLSKRRTAGAKTRELFARQKLEAKNCWHFRVQSIAHSGVFIGVMEVLIAVNVVVKAVQMDIDVRRAVNSQKGVSWGYPVDMWFTGIFVFELLIRIFADQWLFFTGNQRAWNLFDLAVVISSIFEIVNEGLSIGFLRIFRSLRLIRLLKVVRLFRFFRELRLMAVSIASCMVSLFWALVMMFIVVLVFAMFVLEGAKNYMSESHDHVDETRRSMVDLYGSFPEAIYSLIQAISGGGDWGFFAEPLLEVSWMYGAGFALFVSFVTLGMMNILIGIFVENAQQYSQLDRDLVIQEEIHQRKSYMNQLRDLFHEMDEDKSGTITYQEFNDCLSHERAQAYLDFLQLNASEAQGLFMLLDLDENGEVGVEEFVLGCMRLKGAAKSIDAASMMFQTKRLAVKLNEFFDFTREKMDLLVALASARSEALSLSSTGASSNEIDDEMNV